MFSVYLCVYLGLWWKSKKCYLCSRKG